jgi:hypothetical protein
LGLVEVSFAVRHDDDTELGWYVRWVVGVQLDLVDSGRGLEARIGEKLFEVLYCEVGNTNVLHATRRRELLKLSPCVEEIPVWQVLLEIVGVG